MHQQLVEWKSGTTILILTSAACLSFQLELWMAAALHPSLACATGWELYAGRYYQTGTFDSFVCKKKKKNWAILAPIISLRSFIVLLLFLEVLTLTGN